MSRVLAITFALLSLLAAAGCGERAPRFNGFDLTDAQSGHELGLMDPGGRRRLLADFRGQLVMVFFGFTQCPDVCPSALSRAIEVRRLLGADGAKVQVVFITVDPERDTPQLLQAYTQAFDASFLALRGTAEETERVAKDFKVFYEKVATGSSYTVNHSATTFVFDTRGRLRLGESHQMSAEAIAADLRVLLQQDS